MCLVDFDESLVSATTYIIFYSSGQIANLKNTDGIWLNMRQTDFIVPVGPISTGF